MANPIEAFKRHKAQRKEENNNAFELYQFIASDTTTESEEFVTALAYVLREDIGQLAEALSFGDDAVRRALRIQRRGGMKLTSDLLQNFAEAQARDGKIAMTASFLHRLGPDNIHQQGQILRQAYDVAIANEADADSASALTERRVTLVNLMQLVPEKFNGSRINDQIIASLRR